MKGRGERSILQQHEDGMDTEFMTPNPRENPIENTGDKVEKR